MSDRHIAASKLAAVKHQALALLHQPHGPLTRELVQSPGKFGLGLLPDKQQPHSTTTSVCGFCSTGCGLNIHLRDGEAIGLSATTEYPVNLGMACPKGWEALAVLKSNDRATVPLLKNEQGKLMPVDWDTALRTFTARFKAIQGQYGADSVAWLGTGQIPTEEMALLGALGKFGMGMLHGDGNTRQCMATAATAYKQSFGFDAPPFTYQDFEESDVLVFVGANPCIAHPIMWERVMRNPRHPKIVVIDPRRTETAMQALLHLPLSPKSDLELLYGIANILIQRGWIKRAFIDAHTSGYEDFANFVRPYTLPRVSERSGIDAAAIECLARMIHEGRRVSFWWTMGVNQSYEGVRVAQAIINLALMTGNIGRPGTGANSITGQCNAMGSRLYSNTTNLIGGHDFTNPQHRQKVAEALRIDPAVIPTVNSWAYPEIIEGILQGRIRGLWVIATNPAHSWINQSQLHDILGRLDFLVVQDMYSTTETAQLADLVLPAAGWGEKEGTFINSERRFGLTKKVARAPGQALTDFAIFRLVAEYWGCAEMFQEWTSPEAAFQIMKRVSAGQPCDITGIEDYQMLDDLGGVQWPCVADVRDRRSQSMPTQGSGHGSQIPATQGKGLGTQSENAATNNDCTQRRLFEDGRFYHEDGRARFVFEASRPMPEPPNKKYPLVLLTGRGSVAQWHTQTRTGKSAVLRKLSPTALHVELNTHDAAALKVRPNEWVYVESQRGSVRAQAFVTPTIKPGQVFLPMHDKTVNQLTDAVFDPYSRQPSYKCCAVRIRREGAVV